MSDKPDSIERIAADILMSVIQTSHSQNAGFLLKNPDQIADQFKVIHAAVRKAYEERQDF